MADTGMKTDLRTTMFNPSGLNSLLSFAILTLAWLVGFSSRLFAVIRFESIIHEFDPWFNYRATHYMVNHGFYNFLNWFDERAWYPLGRIVGGTVYPGLMVTSGAIHWATNLLNIPIHIRDICVFLAPIFSGMTAVSVYLFTKEIWNAGAGLFAACFIAIVPGYISRSVAGSYDNEGIAIFALMFTYFLWIKSVKTGSLYWAVFTALSYFYMVSAWGGYVFIINLIPLHVFVLVLMGRYSQKIYIAYNAFFIIGLVLSMQVPFVGFNPISTSEHMASAGVFALLNAYAFLKYIQSFLTKAEFKFFFVLAAATAAAVIFLTVVGLTWAGYIHPWSGRFYSLWDTGYAKIHIPIIASVSEHQPTTWVSFFFDLHILVCAFPAGVWFCIKDVNDERVFVVLYAIFASYFAGVMVRLMLTLTPIVCVSAAIAFSKAFEIYLKDDTPKSTQKPSDLEKSYEKSLKIKDLANLNQTWQECPLIVLYAIFASYFAGVMVRLMLTLTPIVCVSAAIAFSKAFEIYLKDDTPKSTQKPSLTMNDNKSDKNLYDKPDKGSKAKKEKKEEKPKDQDALGINIKSIVVIALLMVLMLFAVHCTWVTSSAYSSPSIVLASYNHDGSRTILDDFREAYFWLRQNTDDKARVMSWWDYGYQIAGMGNKTTLVDNNTWNNSHIALVGKAMSSNETAAYEIMRALDVNYVLVIFGGVIGYSGDDINKFLWMVRIAEGEHPKDIRESDYFTPQGEFRVDLSGSQTLLNCLMYKLSYYRFGELQLDFRTPAGYDRTRGVEIGKKKFDLTHLEEAYTSEHWLVRIYKVKDLSNREKNKPIKPIKKSSKKSKKKGTKKKIGSIKNRPKVIKGKKPKSKKL